MVPCLSASHLSCAVTDALVSMACAWADDARSTHAQVGGTSLHSALFRQSLMKRLMTPTGNLETLETSRTRCSSNRLHKSGSPTEAIISPRPNATVRWQFREGMQGGTMVPWPWAMKERLTRSAAAACSAALQLSDPGEGSASPFPRRPIIINLPGLLRGLPWRLHYIRERVYSVHTS